MRLHRIVPYAVLYDFNQFINFSNAVKLQPLVYYADDTLGEKFEHMNPLVFFLDEIRYRGIKNRIVQFLISALVLEKLRLIMGKLQYTLIFLAKAEKRNKIFIA